ncbi:MAG: thioredoxin-dependent thiol peroxidase [Bacteroidetes bacterium]|nr:thioredoxin-dependent thiol peroxidase [Bacteroidota bacterium]
MLKVGQKAPAFTLSDTSGNTIHLKDLLGKKRIVLFFYPKDNTPGCTKEACGFNAKIRTFHKRNLAVFGISPDSVASHQKFATKFAFQFPLLSDPDHKVASAYGAWGPKKLYGREYEGVLRSTFVIGLDGKIEMVFDKVKVDTHAEDLLNQLP